MTDLSVRLDRLAEQAVAQPWDPWTFEPEVALALVKVAQAAHALDTCARQTQRICENDLGRELAALDVQLEKGEQDG